MSKIIATYKGKKIESGKTTFYNGRVEKHSPLPHKQSSYRNQYGMVIRFKNLKLLELEEDGNGGYKLETKIVPNSESKTGTSPVTWDRIVDFTTRSITLDNFVHAEVIQAIRDWPKCVSSKKSEGLKDVVAGTCIEYEPDVSTEKAFEANTLVFAVNNVVSLMVLPEYNSLFRLLCAYFGIEARKDSKLPEKEMFNSFAATFTKSLEAGKSLLGVLEPPSESGVYLEAKMDKSVFNEAVVRLAMQKGIIKEKGGTYYIGSIELGMDSGKILQNNPEKMVKILAEVQDKTDWKITGGPIEIEKEELATENV